MAEEAKEQNAKEETPAAPSPPGIPKVTVPWEATKFLIPAATKGDKAALLLLCKLAVPAWADVEMADFEIVDLGGGFSGNVPFKCAAKGKPTLAVKINPGGEDGGDSLVNAAFNEFNKTGVIPTVYCLGNPLANGLEVYEFLQGTNAGWLLSKHGGEWLDNDDDAKCYGTIIAKLHAHPSGWYEKYKDHVKGQWEAWFVTPYALADEFKAKYGDYAFMTALWGNHFKGLGKNAAAVSSGAEALVPPIYALLPQDTLMGRLVVGHGDAHGCNTMHREVDGHGDLCMIDFDFCGKFPAAIDLLGCVVSQDMCGIFGYFFGGAITGDGYPSLASRRLVAQAYVDQLGEAVVGQYKRTAVDEIVYDMEIGGAMRWLWLVNVMTPFGFNAKPKCTGWACLYWAKAALNLFESAKTDAALKQKILEQGSMVIIRDALLAKDLAPLNMTAAQYESVWNEFGSAGPAFAGGGVIDNDDPPAAASGEEAKKGAGEITAFRSAALKFCESTGADVAAAFKQFDLDNSGDIDLMELMACAMTCGVGFTSTAEAEAKLKELDADGDGKVTLAEFKVYLQAETKADA